MFTVKRVRERKGVFSSKKVQMRVGVMYLKAGGMVGGGVHLPLTVNGFTGINSSRSYTRRFSRK